MAATAATQPTKQLENALNDFQRSLSAENSAQLHAFLTTSSTPNPQDVLQFTAQVDSDNARRKSRCVASRIQGLVAAVQQFSSIVDTFVQANPTAALVWASIKVFILVCYLHYDLIEFYTSMPWLG